MNFQKLIQNGLFLFVCFIAFGQVLNAQWDDTTPGLVHTADNVSIGASTNLGNRQFLVKSNLGTGIWQAGFENGNTIVAMSHNKGYGLLINTRSDVGSRYPLLIKNDVLGEGAIIKALNNGKVGFGTGTPTHRMHVSNDQNVFQTRFQNGDVNVYVAKNTGNGMVINTNNTNEEISAFQLKNSTTNHLFNVMNDGRVIVGELPSEIPANLTTVSNADNETYPYLMFVNGGVIFKEAKVKLTWADYVFEKDYDLASLEEVELNIEAQGHLHNTPSAKEMEANGGIELGAMTVNQQEKIEELFLHLIELNKKVKKLEQENIELKAQK